MKASAVRGLTVLSIADGSRLGRVDEVLFDPVRRVVGALSVRTEAGEGLIPFNGIAGVGDAVTVQDERVLLIGGQGEGLVRLERLKKLKVVDVGGHILGTVDELEIDPRGGQIVALLAHESGLLGLGGTTHRLEPEMIHSLDPEVVTVERAPTR